MSEFYVKDPSEEGTATLFYKRIMYDNDAKMEDYGNLTDFNFAEKHLYGRVNSNFIPMEANFKRYSMKKFPKGQAIENTAAAIDFVVDAFNNLAQQFSKCAMTQKIDTTDPFLTNLKIYKAFEDPKVLYQKHYKSYTSAINSAFKKNNIKVENFEQFVKELMLFFERTANRFPVTYPAFIKSHYCPISVSGLAIEIADLDFNDDEGKIEQFIKSNNWEFYLNACRTYGFMVDKYIPWRLVADIGSSPMIQSARNYGSNSTTEVLRSYYAPAWDSYYRSFKERLLILYDRVKPLSILKTEDCNGVTISNAVEPLGYTLDYIELAFPESFFIETYCKIRFLEEESEFTENERHLIIDDVLEIYESRTINIALMQFERILNKPFDYRGSLSYISKRKKTISALE